MWPPRSPDFSPLDYYLWGRIKERLYHNGPVFEDEEQLENRITQIAGELDADEIRRATQSIGRRLQACLDVGGVHFEQFAH